MPLADQPEMAKHEEQEVHRITDEPRAILEKADLDVEVAHRFGNPTEEIVTQIEEWGADVVVLGRRGLPGVDRLDR
jgi:nucleotide-binding universal stress UspA family protein